MIRLACLLACVSIAFAGPPYIAEPMPRFLTNEPFSVTVSSNWVVISALEKTTNTAHGLQGVLLARRLPSDGQPFQRIVSPSGGGIIHDGYLIIKEHYDTHFYRDLSGTWMADGKISGEGRYESAAGTLLVGDGNHLISGAELYEWPSRRYLQTITPHPWNAVFLGEKLAVSHSIDPYIGVFIV